MNENFILERDSFRDGMSVAELVDAFVRRDPLTNFHNGTRGYCFHGEWILAMLQQLQLYGLHSDPVMEALLDSEIFDAGTDSNVTNSCWNNFEK